jgi:hypothetical protein
MRSKVLVFWILCNGGLVYFVTYTYTIHGGYDWFTGVSYCEPGFDWLSFILPVVAAYQGLRFIGSVLFIIFRMFGSWSLKLESSAATKRAIEQRAGKGGTHMPAGGKRGSVMLGGAAAQEFTNPGSRGSHAVGNPGVATAHAGHTAHKGSRGIAHVHGGAAHRDESRKDLSHVDSGVV